MTVLSRRQMEALGILQEECAEIIQAISKIRRSGPDYKPHGGQETNMDNLLQEILDFEVVLEIAEIGQIRDRSSQHAKKIERLRMYSDIVPRGFV